MRALWMALVLVGCGGIDDEIDRVDFPVVAGEVICKQYEQCLVGLLQSEHAGDMEICEGAEAFWMDGAVIEQEEDMGCTYNAAGGGACLQALAEMECSDFYEAWLEDYATACEGAYSCGG